MKMHEKHLNIWIFGGDRSRNEIWTKNSLSGHGDFSSKFLQKNHRIRDLEEIWRRFERTKYLVIWIFEQIDDLRQAPNTRK